MSAKLTLLDMILKADGSELDAIDKQIAAKQEVLDQHQAEINKLKALRKTVDVMVNGKPERKKREAKKGSSAPPQPTVAVLERRKQIAELLAKQGAMKPAEIAAHFNVPQANTIHWLSTGHFAKTDKGYVLTPQGRQEFLED